tara:strand:+ start:514 stop:768 length:255 start_codon:yes stop_codon:yes gene_type:complete
MKELFTKLFNSKPIQLLIKNTITQISILGCIMIVSSILSNYFDLAYYTMIGSALMLSLIAIGYICFAWIINPIRELIKRNKDTK